MAVGINAFSESMAAHGLHCPDTIIPDGKIQRFHVAGDKSKNKNGWYILFNDGLPAGSYGSWRTGETFTWCGKSEKTMSKAERAELREQIAKAKKAKNEELRRLHLEAQKRAQAEWEKAKPVKDHPYLKAKGVRSYGLCEDNKRRLVIPLKDTTGVIHTLQTINTNGDKLFLFGGAVQKHYFTIGKPDGVILICEGYATGASLHETTGYPVVIAFNAGNLKAVAGALHEKSPGTNIIICGDDDYLTNDNPGLTKAKEAAESVGAVLVVPKFKDPAHRGTDFNDLHQAEGLEAVREQIEEALRTSDLWEKPVLLDDFSLPEMEPVPGIIGEFSQAVSAATETPLELAMGMCLATVATACQRKFIVQVKRGYSEPLNIYVNAVLNSGERKTSVHTETTRPLTTWEAQQRFEVEPVVKEAASQRRNQEARIKSLRARYGKAKRDELDEIEGGIHELESELVEVPVMPKIWVQDITPEHLGTVMSHHNEKIAILSAEGGIFDIIAGRYSRGVPNFDLFLQGHSGDPVRVDRGSRDPIYLEHPALTMGLSTQPEVLRSIADAPGFRGRGLLARFLYLLPKSRLGHRTLETEPVPQHVKEKYESLIHALLNIEPATDEHGNNVQYILHLKCPAYEEWLEFSKVVEKELQEGGRFENVMDWAGKLPGAAARIAGLLHCVKHPQQPWSDQISLETMQQALGLGAIFSNHALKAFNLMGADKSLEGARKVWRWVERGRFKSFKKNDIYNALKGSFPRVADIEPCLDVLEERNYISSFKEKKVGRPSIMYAVNPNFYERWS